MESEQLYHYNCFPQICTTCYISENNECQRDFIEIYSKIKFKNNNRKPRHTALFCDSYIYIYIVRANKYVVLTFMKSTFLGPTVRYQTVLSIYII